VKVSSSLGVRTGAVAVAGILCLAGCGGGGNKTAPPSTTLPPSTTSLPATTSSPSTTAPPATTAAATTPGVYIVQKGDSLTSIAKHFGVTVAQLVAANKIRNQDHVEAGQQLTIPPPTAASGTTAPASTTARKPGTTTRSPTTLHK
jgi:LysM repeat protein